MTINKSQGQSLKHVGVYLEKPVFFHSQPYVVIFRVTSRRGLKFLINDNDATESSFLVVLSRGGGETPVSLLGLGGAQTVPSGGLSSRLWWDTDHPPQSGLLDRASGTPAEILIYSSSEDPAVLEASVFAFRLSIHLYRNLLFRLGSAIPRSQRGEERRGCLILPFPRHLTAESHLFNLFPMAQPVSVNGSTGDLVSKRKHELEGIYSAMDGKTTRIFLDFMTKVTKFEELVAVGKNFLIGFYQGIEKFRTAELHKTSNTISDIIIANWNERLKAYVEAGCRHHQQNIENIYNLHTCTQGLQDHLNKVETLVNELVCLMEDAFSIIRAANTSFLALLDDSSGEEMLHQVLSSEEETLPKHLHDTSISQFIIMKAISDMLKLDYAMQRNIVQALNLKTSSPELESYCLMWDLHPYINDDVMHEAWRLVPPQGERFCSR
ncbi:hypothetical protein Cni_G20281 [Canna indica]|uniref:DUF7795 domain-containing protein n=1 Tax=Canna indica TaxID=4628 RepID=A0AAQ3QJD0_9LILI|nr:hypothetical protein Cni_G20281 [Canna indica]